jgi:hypothetical protein
MMSYEPRSLNPSIMEKRINDLSKASGTGAIPIASAETLGGIKVPADSGITITGSGNAYAYKPIDFTTVEKNTGEKWVDGRDIYRRAISLNETSLSADQFVEVLDDVSTFSSIVSSKLVVKSAVDVGIDHALTYMNVVDNKMYIKPVGTWTNITSAILVIEYTKVPEE